MARAMLPMHHGLVARVFLASLDACLLHPYPNGQGLEHPQVVTMA